MSVIAQHTIPLPLPDYSTPIETHVQLLITQLRQDPRPEIRRRLKIEYDFREVQNGYLSCNYKRVPKIRLKGNWLLDAGFEIERYTQVFYLPNVIIICPERPPIKSNVLSIARSNS